jgi:hypothetical protein
MSDQFSPQDEPEWLNEFEELANQELEDGSSCEQVHPVVERWFTSLMQTEPPDSRPSVAQALSCLSTEVLFNSPDELIENLLHHIDEDDLAIWIEHILMVGRAFEIALQKGDLDDL